MNGHNPIRCRFGAWKEGYDTRENINSLWKFLKGSPVIIIIPVWTDTKQLQFDICMWGNSISNIGYTTIHPESLVFDLNCKNDINEIAASICYYVGLISDLYHMIFMRHSHKCHL